MEGFKTIKITDDFVPEIADIPSLSKKAGVHSALGCKANGVLFILDDALKDLNDHIHWSEYRRENLVEQGGFMLGNVYRDTKTHVLFGIVRRLIPVDGAEGSAAYLDMGTDASYDAVMNEQAVIQESKNKLRRIGWYHTHPGSLGVFMSGTDMQTQTKSYFREWQFAVVLNPQKRIWRGFRGAKAIEVDCVFVGKRDDQNIAVFFQAPRTQDIYHRTEPRYSEHKQQALSSNTIVEKKIHIQINGSSIILNNYVLAVDTFVSQLFSAFSVSGSTNKIQSICIEALLDIKTDNEILEFVTVSSINHSINISDTHQVRMAFEHNNESPHLIHTFIHFVRDFNLEEIEEMVKRIDINAVNGIFCVFQISKGDFVKYFICDGNKNTCTGEIEAE